MSTVIINPGVCGLICKVSATKKGRNLINIEIDTKCAHINKMKEELKEIDGMNECFSKISSSKVYELADQCIQHLSCPIPSGILKAIEVECGLALPRDVDMKITKE